MSNIGYYIQNKVAPFTELPLRAVYMCDKTVQFNKGTLTEGEGSVQLTSTLRYLVL